MFFIALFESRENMEYLKILKKDKLGMFIFSLCSIIGIVLFFKRSFIVVYNYFAYGDMGLWSGDVGQCIVILIGGIPAIICYFLKIIEYIEILSDIKRQQLITEVVVSLSKPDVTAFDRYKPGKKDENDIYYVWKVKNEKEKKLKMIYFKNVFSFVGKTISHTYEVTYYKYSKVIVDVKKIK